MHKWNNQLEKKEEKIKESHWSFDFLPACVMATLRVLVVKKWCAIVDGGPEKYGEKRPPHDSSEKLNPSPSRKGKDDDDDGDVATHSLVDLFNIYTVYAVKIGALFAESLCIVQSKGLYEQWIAVNGIK